MDAIQAVVLGIIQGTLEWLPVSSQGQSMLAMMHWLGLTPKDALTCSIFLHLGTMSAVLIRFRQDFLMMARGMDGKLTRIVLVSTLCTGITGIPLFILFQESFRGGKEATLLIGTLLIATGLMLRYNGSGGREVEEMSLVDMILLGLAQGFSILPGVSRSGTTLTLLLMRGLKQDRALALSFIISVPAVLGAVILEHNALALQWQTATAMLASSFGAGYLTMELLIRSARRINFSGFCLALGLITLLLSILP